jgi:Ser/Thr protein kinase RdoA (MazF antagonist)
VADHPAISALVEREYLLGTPFGSTLLSQGMNEVYRIDLPDGPYALRIHGDNKWWLTEEGSLRFELDLLTHLNDHGVPVSRPVPRSNGDVLGRVRQNDAERFYSLFTWAEGVPGGDGLTDDQAHLVGRLIAEIHVAADQFHSELPRYELGEETLLDRPLRILEPALRRADTDLAAGIRAEIERIRERLRAFDPGPTGWGIIHGDPQDLNYHLTADGKITIFDFDLCGYGWRAYDLAYYYTRIPEPFRQSALDGYDSVRRLSMAERELLPTFGQAAWVKEGTMVGSGLHPHELAKNLADPFQS